MLKSIAVIYMGGTFGCTGIPLSPLPAEQFLPTLQQLTQQELPSINLFESAANIRDSSQLNPQDWIDLIKQLHTLLKQGYQKFIIIHGTDTLAYTAAFVAEFFAQQAIQLVVTGSQFPLLETTGQQLEPASDALHNLRTAYQQLIHTPVSGCWVAFDGQVWPASSVQKIHTTATPTFSGHQLTPFDGSFTQPDFNLTALETLNIAVYYALPLAAQQQAAQLQHLLELPHIQAIVMLAFGSGNLTRHTAMEQVLTQAAQQQVMIVLGSQVPFGGVNIRYAAGHWLSQFGVLSAGHLPLPAIYARLAALLCQNLSFSARQQQWQHQLTAQNFI